MVLDTFGSSFTSLVVATRLVVVSVREAGGAVGGSVVPGSTTAAVVPLVRLLVVTVTLDWVVVLMVVEVAQRLLVEEKLLEVAVTVVRVLRLVEVKEV